MAMALTPPMILVYGPMGVGKTTDIYSAFPTALNVCRPGGLLPAATFLGLRPGRGIDPIQRTIQVVGADGKTIVQEWSGFAFEWFVRTLDDVITIVPNAANMGFPAVLVDDVSLDAETTERELDRQYGNTGGNVFRKFDGIRDRVVKIREACRYAGIPVAMSAHLRLPGPDSKGIFLKGGPKFPTRNLTESIPYEADVVLRMALAKGDWRAIYDRSDPDYAGKDRLSVTPLKAPGNLRAIMVAAGYTCPRFPGLEWQDEIMVHVRDRMHKGDARDPVIRETFSRVDKPDEHVAWAVRDGLALAEIQSFVSNRYIDDFFTAGAVKDAPVVLGGAG